MCSGHVRRCGSGHRGVLASTLTCGPLLPSLWGQHLIHHYVALGGVGDEQRAVTGKSEPRYAMFSPAVQFPLPHSMHLIDSDGTTYIAQQMHFHWGGGPSGVSGSEHTFDGFRRAIEV